MTKFQALFEPELLQIFVKLRLLCGFYILRAEGQIPNFKTVGTLEFILPVKPFVWLVNFFQITVFTIHQFLQFIIDFYLIVLYNVLEYVLNNVLNMLPKIVSPSELRKNLASLLDLAMKQLIVVKDKESNKVIMDEREYNRLSALANQFMLEDPEGKYLPKFEKEVLRIAREDEYDNNVKSITDVL